MIWSSSCRRRRGWTKRRRREEEGKGGGGASSGAVTFCHFVSKNGRSHLPLPRLLFSSPLLLPSHAARQEQDATAQGSLVYPPRLRTRLPRSSSPFKQRDRDRGLVRCVRSASESSVHLSYAWNGGSEAVRGACEGEWGRGRVDVTPFLEGVPPEACFALEHPLTCVVHVAIPRTVWQGLHHRQDRGQREQPQHQRSSRLGHGV